MNSQQTTAFDINEKPKNLWLIVTTVMMVAILEVLDSTIINVALPHMMPSLGANSEEITWILTSYVVAAAMMLPLTGFLTERFGQKRLLIVNISGFLFSSIFCGIATSLPMMVFFRLLQGGFGAALVPLSQAILRSNFPAKEQSKAMAIWGMGIMVAPVFGPTIGGYITQHTDWRWVFYINVPVCILALIFTVLFIKESLTYIKKIDWLSVALMFIGTGTLQTFLDQGNSHDWFSSNWILLLTVTSIYCLTFFIFRSLRHPAAVINLKIFKDRNFAVTTAILAIYCGAIFGTITLEPIMLETLFHYTAVIAGNVLMAIGIGSVLMVSIVPTLMKKFDPKIILSTGLILDATALWYLSTLNLHASEMNFIIANAIFGAGVGLMMVPLATYSLLTLPKASITEGAGLFSYGRMLGSSVGISLCATLSSRLSQMSWHQLGAHINEFNPQLKLWLAQQHLQLHAHTTIAKLATSLDDNARMIGYISAYRIIAFALILLVGLVMLIKRVNLNEEN